jgi:hypothetical protein
MPAALGLPTRARRTPSPVERFACHPTRVGVPTVSWRAWVRHGNLVANAPRLNGPLRGPSDPRCASTGASGCARSHPTSLRPDSRRRVLRLGWAVCLTPATAHAASAAPRPGRSGGRLCYQPARRPPSVPARQRTDCRRQVADRRSLTPSVSVRCTPLRGAASARPRKRTPKTSPARRLLRSVPFHGLKPAETGFRYARTARTLRVASGGRQTNPRPRQWWPVRLAPSLRSA